MNIFWLQPFWFDGFFNSSNDEQRNLLTIQLPNANIVVQASLTAFSGGANLDANVAGSGAVGVREFTSDGNWSGVQSSLVGHLQVNNCTELTMELGLILSSASASGIIFYIR